LRHRLRPRSLTRLALLALLTSLVAPGAAAAAFTSFHSPSRNIECEVSANDPRGTYAYCQTFAPLRSVKLVASGTYKVCNGVRCVGNGPLDALTLGYGRSLSVGPFRCTSLRTGMRCVVTQTGHGFVLSRAGAARV
jgi:hypothetical protein